MNAPQRELAENPEAHPAFQAMRVAALGRPERSMGDAVIAAEPPRWSEVREHARELDALAPHLETLTALVRADTALEGFAGLHRSLERLADTLEGGWATLWPEPDEDDPDEPWYARSNLLADLAADRGFLDALQRAPLVEARGIGAFSTRDLEIAAGLVAGDEEERERCQVGLVNGAFAESDVEALGATRAAIDGAIAACARVAGAFEREVGGGAGQVVAPIAERLQSLRARFLERAASRLDAGEAANDGGGDAAVTAAGAVAAEAPVGEASAVDAAAPSSLADHDAVRAALGEIVRYYARHEPGSPVAVLVARVRTLVGRDFFELIGTLFPENELGGDLAARLGGARRDPLATLLQEGFGGHLAGEAAMPDAEALVAEAETGSADAPPPSVEARGDVLRTIDEVLAFYRLREPSSPVPLVLARVRALVTLDFDGVLEAVRRALASGTEAAGDEG